MPTGVDEPEADDDDGGNAAAEGLVGAAMGPASEALADTILTAATRFFVLKTVFPLLLLRRLGARGREILSVAVMRVVRPPDDDKMGVRVVVVVVVLPVLLLLVDERAMAWPSAASVA